MKEMCRVLIQYANKIGMEVVSSLNVEEQTKYMEELRALHERQAKEAEEAQKTATKTTPGCRRCPCMLLCCTHAGARARNAAHIVFRQGDDLTLLLQEVLEVLEV